MPISIAIVGLGAVGTALARALAQAGAARLTLVGIGRQRERQWAAQQAGRYIVGLNNLSDDIDIIVLAIDDRVMGSVAAKLSRLALPWKRISVLHTSGSLGSEVLKPLAAGGAGVAAWHPFQTFPARARNVPLAGITFGITGNRRGVSAATRLTALLGGRPLKIGEADRVLYHLSAVLACGFVAADLQAAVAVLKSLGISEKRALDTVLPIATSTLSNIRELGIEAAQTGPAVRGDVATMRKHRKALRERAPELETLYRALTDYVLKTRGKDR